jgi:hypothetical protein
MDNLFESAAMSAREHAAVVLSAKPVVEVHLLWVNVSVLGVYRDFAEAGKVAVLVMEPMALKWVAHRENEWIGWAGTTKMATVRIDTRRIG